jgi:hypothetical protein
MSVNPVVSISTSIDSTSIVSPKIYHINRIIADIRIPVTAPITSPFLSAGDLENSLPSTRRYQYAGAISSHNLHVKKKICDVNSSSL